MAIILRSLVHGCPGISIILDTPLDSVLEKQCHGMSTMGQFCCEIPDATSTNTRICINVVGKHQICITIIYYTSMGLRVFMILCIILLLIIIAQKQESTYTHDGAIGVAVGATIFIECQIGALVIITLLVHVGQA